MGINGAEMNELIFTFVSFLLGAALGGIVGHNMGYRKGTLKNIQGKLLITEFTRDGKTLEGFMQIKLEEKPKC
jgi:hypothetical protein